MNRKHFLTGCLAGLGLALASCSNGNNPNKMPETKEISQAEIVKILSKKFSIGTRFFFGDTLYKQADREWIEKSFYPYFRDDVFNKGVVKWDERFDCDKFSRFFAALIQIRFFVDNFHSFSKAQSITVGELYYLVGGVYGKGHAINIMLVNDEILFFEPQTGKFVNLSQREINTAWLIKF